LDWRHRRTAVGCGNICGEFGSALGSDPPVLAFLGGSTRILCGDRVRHVPGSEIHGSSLVEHRRSSVRHSSRIGQMTYIADRVCLAALCYRRITFECASLRARPLAA
jgi:hypothetical protein